MLCAGFDPSGNSLSASYNRAVLYVSAALESIHTYSLIHDDLPAMDDDDLRRGKPSCHKAFSEWAAILAGDALNTLAFELIALGAKEFPSVEGVEMVRILSRDAGMNGMAGGQSLDLESEKNPRDLDRAALERVLVDTHRRKTAALIRSSCELGAHLAGVENKEAFREFGGELGLLFQIADDILDVTGDEQSLGKAANKDAEKGKLTYAGFYGLEHARQNGETLCERLKLQAASLPSGKNAQSDWRHVLSSLTEIIFNRSR